MSYGRVGLVSMSGAGGTMRCGAGERSRGLTRPRAHERTCHDPRPAARTLFRLHFGTFPGCTLGERRARMTHDPMCPWQGYERAPDNVCWRCDTCRLIAKVRADERNRVFTHLDAEGVQTVQ